MLCYCIHTGNGQIDIHDLSEALKHFHLSHQYAERFLRQTDTENRGHVNLAEFIHYIREHEKNLLLHFTHLDKDGDGNVNLEDLISGFKELGIEIDADEALQLLKRVDQNDTLNISYDEWRDFLLLAPAHDIQYDDLFNQFSQIDFLYYNNKTIIISFELVI